MRRQYTAKGPRSRGGGASSAPFSKILVAENTQQPLESGPTQPSKDGNHRELLAHVLSLRILAGEIEHRPRELQQPALRERAHGGLASAASEQARDVARPCCHGEEGNQSCTAGMGWSIDSRVHEGIWVLLRWVCEWYGKRQMQGERAPHVS